MPNGMPPACRVTHNLIYRKRHNQNQVSVMFFLLKTLHVGVPVSSHLARRASTQELFFSDLPRFFECRAAAVAEGGEG